MVSKIASKVYEFVSETKRGLIKIYVTSDFIISLTTQEGS